MKYFYILFFTLFLSFNSQAQIVNIPDANFKNALINHSPVIDTNGDSEIQMSEAIGFEGALNISGENIDDITGIEVFENIIYLDVSLNNINFIDVSPLLSLEGLNVIHNNLQIIDLSSNINLTEFQCNFNNFTNLDFTNNVNIERLFLGYNYSLNNINISNCLNLEHLNLINTQITDIDLSPFSALGLFFCDNTYLVALDVTQNINLITLSITGTFISSLDLSQNTLLSYIFIDDTYMSGLDLSNNPFINSVYTNDTSNLMSINLKNGGDWLSSQSFDISNCPNLSFICVDEFEDENSVVQNALQQNNYTNVIVNDYCSFVPGGTFYSIEGVSKIDADSNGCSTDDVGFPFLKFNITDGQNVGTIISNNTGMYSIPVQDGNHTITPIFENPDYFNVSPPSVTVNFPTETSPFIQDFCITANGVHKELDLTIIPLNAARPGFDANYRIIYTNTGNTTIDFGQIILTNNFDLMTEVAFTPFWDSFTTVDQAWHFNYETLLPFESRTTDFTMNINTPVATFPVNGGDVLTFNVNHFIEYDGIDPETNVALHQTVVNSFDPNDKTCLEGDTITPEMVGEYVHYLIRFENTGTADAINIVVKDVIDTNKFDISKLVPLHGSHEFVTRITNTNEVEFIFENINLPFDDANNDGYVVFKIKTLPTLALGDTFSNSAEIYFDYNAPIVTNDFLTTVEEPLSVVDVNSKALKVYPNPVKNNLFIESASGIRSATIYDVNGRLLNSISFTEHALNQTVDVSQLSKGIYFVRIMSEGGEVTSKVIKE